MSLPIKILYLSHSAQMSGGEICLLTLLRNLDRNRFEPVVVFPSEGPLKDAITQLGIRSYCSPLEWWVLTEGNMVFSSESLQSRVAKLVLIINQERPHIVHSNTSVIWEGALAALLTGTRHVWHFHEILQGHPSLEPILPLPLFYWIINRLPGLVVVVSDTARSQVAGLIEADRIVRIYNGIEPPLANQKTTQNVRKELQIPDDATLSLTVASLAKYKGLDLLLQVAADVVSEHQGIYFVIAGPGSNEAKAILEKQIAKLGLLTRVKYIGYRNDISSIIEASDVIVISSVNESFSLVAAEAMSMSKPVITTDCGGPVELVVDGETGFVVPLNNSDKLSKCIIEIANDVSLQLNFGNSGQKRYSEFFTSKIYANNFHKMYENLYNANICLQNIHFSNELIEACLATYQEMIDSRKNFLELQERMKLLESHINDLQTKYHEDQGTIGELEQDIANLEIQVSIRDKTIDTLYNSVSWRLTSPLRRICDKFNAIKRED